MSKILVIPGLDVNQGLSIIHPSLQQVDIGAMSRKENNVGKENISEVHELLGK